MGTATSAPPLAWADRAGDARPRTPQGDDRVQFVLHLGGNEPAGLYRFLTTFIKTLARATAEQRALAQ